MDATVKATVRDADEVDYKSRFISEEGRSLLACQAERQDWPQFRTGHTTHPGADGVACGEVCGLEMLQDVLGIGC